MSKQPPAITIKNRIYGKGRGWVFTPSDFLDVSSEVSTWSVLSQLVEVKTIRRLKQGLYEYPRHHTLLGTLPPEPQQIADAVARKLKIKIQPSGAYAANILGLSDQMPGKITFITDGESRTVKIPGVSINFKKTTPKRMKTAGTISGLVFEALRFLTEKHITSQVISKLNRRLNKTDKKRLCLDIRYSPAWMSKIIQRELCNA